MSNLETQWVEFSSATSLQKFKSSILSIAVGAFVVPGLVATVALPAYAYTPADAAAAETAKAAASLQQLKAAEAQTMFVSAAAEVTTVARDTFNVTSAAEIVAASYPAYSGPSASDFLANPPYPNFSLDQVVQVALQYRGVPYRFGGSDPSGFDCSGYVAFVYAQFGVALPHSVSGAAAMGTPIATADALPGDLVIMAGHSGIYMGNGTFIDSADYGSVIRVRPIYDSNYYIVRVGI